MSSFRLITFLFFALGFSQAVGQDNALLPDTVTILPIDSSAVEVRQVDQVKLRELKESAELDYGTGPAVMSLWERFKIWLRHLIASLFEVVVTTDWVNVLIIGTVIIVLVYVIMRLLRIDALKVLYSGSGRSIRYDTIHENIHEMDFDKLLEEAVQKADYRLAIRLLFLQALKILSDKHIIHWQPGKTNHDYLNEVKAAELKAGFQELNLYFEYAWYGNFTIAPESFGKVRDIFNNWKTKV